MRTVVGLYNRFEDAQQAVQALSEAGFGKEDINLIARDTNGEYRRYLENSQQGQSESVGKGAAAGAGTGAILGGLGGLLLGLGALAIPGIGPVLAAGPIAATLAGAGAGAVAGGIVGALVGLGIPKEHAQAYAEGIRRGGTLVTVRAQDNMADQAVQILERFNPVDIGGQMQNWRNSNWQGFDENAEPMDVDQMETSRQEENIPVTGSEQGVDIPVIEEEMNVGKQTTETGRVRVETYTEEIPFEQDVELRQEHVNVERRPVNREATEADMQAFKEGSMEFTETEEHVVAEKRPKVVEEVHVDKDVDTTTETVRDTLHRQDVNVEQSGTGDFQRFDQNFHRHFDQTYGSRGMSYNDYMPAYRYGYTLASDRRFSSYDWNSAEPEARAAWERRYGQGTWDQVKDAVRYAWETTRG